MERPTDAEWRMFIVYTNWSSERITQLTPDNFVE